MFKKAKFNALLGKVTTALKDEKVQAKIKSGIEKAAKSEQGQKIIKKIANSKIGKTILSKLKLNFTQEEWEETHEQGTVEENKVEMDEIGYNISKLTSLKNTDLKKVVYICCNTYERPEYSLGVGPMNDAITVGSYMREIGFQVYYSHNPKSTEYLKYLRYFYHWTTDYLVVYYTGHGASVKDTDGDEDDKMDEALVFDDDFIVDDELASVLANSEKKPSSKVLLLNDCCHSGSIYDLQTGTYQGLNMPPNLLSISAARDKQTAKQTSVGSKDQGIFTFYFFKFLSSSPKMTPKQMETQSQPYLNKFDQNFVAYATTSNLLNQPIFP
ncbi:hypothetical protein M9Y10_022677 [Tritrichomonas musculus]|uniref:Peptidase C14 caspase domain-containing protein n=1 Tax=Tritrichomonas musculus TaxID=1915356 RepID=A0ABR2KTU0_9EUKA